MKTEGRCAFPFGVLVSLAFSATAFGQNPPTAPLNLSASCSTSTGPLMGVVSLSWQDNSNNETFFRIWRRRLPDVAYAIIEDVPADTEDWGEAYLNPGESFCYSVTAHNTFGQSTLGGPTEVCVYTLTPPVIVDQIITATTVTLDWDPVLNANRYSVRLGSSCNNAGEIAQTGGTSHVVSGLSDGTYYWRVAAMNFSGLASSSFSEASACGLFTIGSGTQDTQAPVVTITQPTTNDAYLTPNSEIELRGTASDNVGVTQAAWADTMTGGNGTCTGTTNWSTFAIPLQPGENYLRVTARDAANNSSYDELTVTYAPPPGLPTVSLELPINDITSESATCGGIVTDQGTANVTRRGVCWNTTGYPNASNNYTSDGSGGGAFASFISGLAAGTTYYVRAYAISSVGTAYSTQSMFSTIPASAVLPTVTIGTVTNITLTSAESGGNVTAEGGSSVTVRGVCWNTSGVPTVDNTKTTNGSGLGAFNSNMNGLIDNTIYYVRAYATNSAGTGYSSQSVFTTTAAQRFSLTLISKPATAGTIAAFPPPINGGYLSGTIVTLTATPFVGYQFGHWSGDVTGSSISTAVAIYDNRNVTANFATPPPSNKAWFGGRVTESATGAAVPQAWVQWGDSGFLTDFSGNYALNAVPCPTNDLRVTKAGYVSWSESYSPPCDQTSVRNIVITRTKVNLTVLSDKAEGGRAKINGTLQDLPWSGVLDHGTAVSIEAAPASEWAFDYWERNGANDGTDTVRSFVITADTSVTAHFKSAPVPDAAAPGAQSTPCGAMGNCGATGIMTLAFSFIGLGYLRKKRN